MEKRSTKWDLTAYPNYEVENLPGYALHLIEEAQAAGKPGNRSRDTIKQVILNKSDIIRLIQKLSNLIIGYHLVPVIITGRSYGELLAKSVYF